MFNFLLVPYRDIFVILFLQHGIEKNNSSLAPSKDIQEYSIRYNFLIKYHSWIHHLCEGKNIFEDCQHFIPRWNDLIYNFTAWKRNKQILQETEVEEGGAFY